MTILKHKLTNDLLFKMLFVQYPELLKLLVAVLLRIPLEDITEFVITNPEIPPDSLGEKFCELDINMIVNGQRVDLEVQVRDEGDYPERSLYYWARDFSSALPAGGNYSTLPRTVVVSIAAFELFPEYEGFHSEFAVIETRRGARLSDRLNLQYFELPKIPQEVSADDKIALWLSLFAAETEEDLKKIEALEVPELNEAIGAYRHTTARPEFEELERLRERARHNEASALANAEKRGEQRAAKTYEKQIADKDAKLAEYEKRFGSL